MIVPIAILNNDEDSLPCFFHQTQKDGVMFQGEDLREFWVRAEDRNKETAGKYQALGLASYAAMEAFVRHRF